MKNLIRTDAEIINMRECGKILAFALNQVAAAVKPGVSTAELDKLAQEVLLASGAKPSFLGYPNEAGQPFPASLCTSVNDEVVHGIPLSKKVITEGDIIGLDLGCWYKGVCTDAAVTVPVGKVSNAAKKLIKITEQSLVEGLKQIKDGVSVGDIGEAIQAYVEANGFAVVKQLTGHGVGREVHEEPAIPNFGKKGSGPKLLAGMTVAIEPMVNAGDYEVRTTKDGWTVATIDGSLSAHFEHTVLVTNQGCEILTVC